MAGMHGRSRAAGIAVIALAIGATACGSSSNMQQPSPGPCTTPATSTTIVISGGAVCPQNITVARGSQVTMVNQDTVAHEMYSDPHPEHTDCPELNQIGHLEPGQSRASGNLVTARTCGFHDHLRPDVAGLKGRITIQ
jgi:plastocyanin